MRKLGALLAVLAIVLCPVALADGKVWKGGPDYSTLAPLEMNEQRAAIAHADGVQKMIIAVNIDLEDADSALWMFPVPGSGETTELDVVDTFPDLGGDDVLLTAEERVDELFMIARATQIYPLFLELVSMGGKARNTMASVGGVMVHEQLERWGIHAETVSVDSLEALEAYVAEKKAPLPREELEAFAPYLSGEHVLVLVWIADQEEVRRQFPEYARRERGMVRRQPCVYVEFPTERAFFPLKPTAAYGAAHIPVQLYVLGFVEPETAPSLERRLSVSHHVDRDAFASGLGVLTGGRVGGRVSYTSVRIDTPARDFTDDLWLVPARSFRLAYASAIESLGTPAVGLIVVMICVALLSYVSGGIAGCILHRRWGPYAWLGLWNLLSVVGVVLAIHYCRTNKVEKYSEAGPKYVGVFSLTYLVLAVALEVLAVLPLR